MTEIPEIEHPIEKRQSSVLVYCPHCNAGLKLEARDWPKINRAGAFVISTNVTYGVQCSACNEAFCFRPIEAQVQPTRALVTGPTPLQPSEKVPDGWALCRHEPTAAAPGCVRHPRWAVGATGSAASTVEHYHPADVTVSLKAYIDYQPLPEMIAESLAAHLDVYESKGYDCLSDRISDSEFIRGYMMALIHAGIMFPNHPLAIMIAYS